MTYTARQRHDFIEVQEIGCDLHLPFHQVLMVFNPLLDADDAALHTHIGLPDAESALFEVEFMRVEQEVDVADADELIDAVYLHEGIAQDKVGRRVPMVEEVCLDFVFADRRVDFQRIGIQGIGLAHISHHRFAIQGDAGVQALGRLTGCGHKGERWRIDVGVDGVVVHIEMAEFHVSIQQHLLEAALEVVGR